MQGTSKIKKRKNCQTFGNKNDGIKIKLCIKNET